MVAGTFREAVASSGPTSRRIHKEEKPVGSPDAAEPGQIGEVSNACSAIVNSCKYLRLPCGSRRYNVLQ